MKIKIHNSKIELRNNNDINNYSDNLKHFNTKLPLMSVIENPLFIICSI